ncbi:MAG TPA: hypothetical protein VF803_03670 [Candidatus Paceibacterota bacterium]
MGGLLAIGLWLSAAYYTMLYIGYESWSLVGGSAAAAAVLGMVCVASSFNSARDVLFICMSALTAALGILAVCLMWALSNYLPIKVLLTIVVALVTWIGCMEFARSAVAAAPPHVITGEDTEDCTWACMPLFVSALALVARHVVRRSRGAYQAFKDSAG